MRSLTVLPLVLLSATTVVADQSFREFLEDKIPSCVMDCATGSLNNITTDCSNDAASSNNAEDINCVCDVLREADSSVVVDFTESLSGCVVDADCSSEDLEELSDIEPQSFQDGMCQSNGGGDGGDGDSTLAVFTF